MGIESVQIDVGYEVWRTECGLDGEEMRLPNIPNSRITNH
jgi:hypothetical protein